MDQGDIASQSSREKISNLIRLVDEAEELIKNQQENSHEGTASIKSFWKLRDYSHKVRSIAKTSGDKKLKKQYGKYRTPLEISEYSSGKFGCGCFLLTLGGFIVIYNLLEYFVEN